MSDPILEHFGTKGMRWGVRRSQKKQAKQHYRNLLKQEIEKQNALRKPKVDALMQEINYLTSHFTFDADDGGGRTAEDNKAGRKYVQLYDQIYKHELSAENEARKIVAQQIVKDLSAKKVSET